MEKLVDKRKRGKLASSWSKQSNIDQYEYKYNVQTKRDIEKDVFLIGKVHSKVTEDYRIAEVSVFFLNPKYYKERKNIGNFSDDR